MYVDVVDRAIKQITLKYLEAVYDYLYSTLALICVCMYVANV